MTQQVTKAERVTERLTPWLSLIGVIGFLCAIVLAACPGCASGPQAAFSLKMDYQRDTPADASVVIDEQYVGPLGYVAAHGVRLRLGEHRVSITKPGYFPYDRLVEKSDSEPFKLDVKLEKVPD